MHRETDWEDRKLDLIEEDVRQRQKLEFEREQHAFPRAGTHAVLLALLVGAEAKSGATGMPELEWLFPAVRTLFQLSVFIAVATLVLATVGFAKRRDPMSPSQWLAALPNSGDPRYFRRKYLEQLCASVDDLILGARLRNQMLVAASLSLVVAAACTIFSVGWSR
jgi:hypothetical protein